MNRASPASPISVTAGDGVGVIAEVSQVRAGPGVNVEPMNAAVMGDEDTVVPTRDCYDHSQCVLNQSRSKSVSDDAPVLRLPNQPSALATMAGNPNDAGSASRACTSSCPQAGHLMTVPKTDNRPEAIGPRTSTDRSSAAEIELQGLPFSSERVSPTERRPSRPDHRR